MPPTAGDPMSGQLDEILTIDEVADWLLRVVLLVLTLPPEEQQDTAVRRFVGRLIVPALVPQ